MKKKTIIWASVAAVAVIGVGAAVLGPLVYRDLIVGPPAAAPSVQATAPSPSGAPPGGPGSVSGADLSGPWRLAEGSFAGYRVNEVLNGTAVTVVGRTEEVTGSFSVDRLTLTEAEVSVDVASIETDSAPRDNYFRSTAVRTDEFPDAVFRLLEPVTAAAPPVGGEVQSVTVRGELALNGVTRPVQAELQAVLAGSGGQVGGSLPITFADFGIEAPNLSFVSVEESGTIEFLLNIVPG